MQNIFGQSQVGQSGKTNLGQRSPLAKAAPVSSPTTAGAVPFNFRFDETPQREKFRCDACRRWRAGEDAMTVVIVEDAGDIPVDGTYCCHACADFGAADVTRIVDAKAKVTR
jgi:hypothetical protein